MKNVQFCSENSTKDFKLKWIVCFLFSHLPNAAIASAVSLRDTAQAISQAVTFATKGWGHWRTKTCCYIMGRWWVKRLTWFIFSPLSKMPVSEFTLKCVHSLVNFACFLEKGYLSSWSTPVSFAEIFLSLILHWLAPLGVFFDFFYFYNFAIFPPFSLEKLVLLTFDYCFH